MLSPGARVLDIGAGPGNIAIPAAKIAARLTAVEPAPGMAAVLREQIALENMDNIHFINKKWDDVDTEELRVLEDYLGEKLYHVDGKRIRYQ
jgi:FkbM family methyltransferase